LVFNRNSNNNNNNNNASGRVFLSKLGRKLADQSGDEREISFLFQRLYDISIIINLYKMYNKTYMAIKSRVYCNAVKYFT